ncbi:glycosyl hydrolase family 31 protein [Emydomyces testavorans]|uniref:Probable alpha/beta-glucosidase agdC n=1 Tax=Emydomyces testavorans TaxID=2070801 RepID=A0AAF0DAH2_9EURO|nr:glycosyl hydrolase family 31 protein [Emydomyces testavorans]
MAMLGMSFLGLLFSTSAAELQQSSPQALLGCPGYRVSNVYETKASLTLDLQLAGKPCNVYGKDFERLVFKVEYQTESRLHVMIYDADEDVYQVPESVLPRPSTDTGHNSSSSALQFSYESDPFTFSVKRKDNDEILFDTDGYDLVFQSQYLHLQTSLPDEPNLYGLGEHSDPLRLRTTNYTRALWNRDAYGIPSGTNLYGSHPVYFEHRGSKGTHGVFLLNSNGMDIKIDKSRQGRQYLEYNVLGGIIDLYFLAGPSPIEVASQYAEIVGLPAMIPYWGFGFHQCRYGYRDIFDVAEVVYNYSQANIPLETMWTDIDYMDRRRVFTLDPERFPLGKMRSLVNYLHQKNLHYIVMVDPAVSYSDNGAYKRGEEQDVFLKMNNGSIHKGVVWPGVTVYPDWFHPLVQEYWNKEFELFFAPRTGVDIDGLWIDMNEAANFCNWPCRDPEAWARDNGLPPDPPEVRLNPRPLPGFPAELQPPVSKRGTDNATKLGPFGLKLLEPRYEIHNAAGALSNKTISTDVIHANGFPEYDVHNLYGTTSASRCGDNLSTWDHYRISIAQMLAFASIFQIPMVGSDVCGFGGVADAQLCARWAMLGAFYPFFRNHNEIKKPSQEFYVWDSVAEAARNAIEIRYKLMDYIYTALHRQSQTGKPILNPLFFLYPNDEKTFAIDLQFFYGDAILVSPVTEDNATSVDLYLPDDIFYDYHTGVPVRGEGQTITLDNLPITHIPLHIRGGTIIPLRTSSGNTTTELRKQPFELLIAPGLDGNAFGRLYLDDGESLRQERTTEISFEYRNEGTLEVDGRFDCELEDGVRIERITLLGLETLPDELSMAGGREGEYEYFEGSAKLVLRVELPLTQAVNVTLVRK